MTEIELTKLMGPAPNFASEHIPSVDQKYHMGHIIFTGLVLLGVIYLISLSNEDNVDKITG